ncbi:MAG: hypothetical protein QY331_09110 [Melioribacteraceae bacterium]|nr:MAG: hypothetical protein QY331_09110 [Melioribacteraceae bacterium]
MAIYRNVHISFWSDPFVLELTPEEKYFFLYLMTNSKTSQIGIYELPKSIIQFETGYNNDTVEKLMSKFIDYGKIKYDQKTKEVLLNNWLKYNYSNSPKVIACMEKELKSIKSKQLKNEFYRVCKQYQYSINTLSQKEQEEEQEKEESVDNDFENFWLLYDKKVCKNKCIKKWKMISKSDKEKIFNTLPVYIKATPNKKYRKDPMTYLNNESWNDEIIEGSNQSNQQNGKILELNS